MIDFVRRRRVRVGIAVGPQFTGIGKWHRRSLRRLRTSHGAAQRVAGADLIRGRPRRSRTWASDRGIDRHRREVCLLRFGTRERCHGDQAGDCRNLLAGIAIELFFDRDDRCDRAQRPRRFYLTHPPRPMP